MEDVGMSILNADYSNLSCEEMAHSIGLQSKYIPLLVESFLEESKGSLETLRESIKRVDYIKVKSEAHTLKGSAGNLRFNEIYEMAKKIEFAASSHREDFAYEECLNAIEKAIGTISL
jgi:two-component system sensor histidine kinase/response regulator